MAARATYLDDILARHRAEAARDHRDLVSLVDDGTRLRTSTRVRASAPSSRAVGHRGGEAAVPVEGGARARRPRSCPAREGLRTGRRRPACRCSPTSSRSADRRPTSRGRAQRPISRCCARTSRSTPATSATRARWARTRCCSSRLRSLMTSSPASMPSRKRSGSTRSSRCTTSPSSRGPSRSVRPWWA